MHEWWQAAICLWIAFLVVDVIMDGIRKGEWGHVAEESFHRLYFGVAIYIVLLVWRQ